MPEQINYSPKNPSYVAKSRAIEDFRNSSQESRELGFLKIGELLFQDSHLSNKQKEVLIDSLRTQDLVTYPVRIMEDERDPETFFWDMARYDIETNAKLQARAIAISYEAAKVGFTLPIALDKTIGLLNEAHTSNEKFTDPEGLDNERRLPSKTVFDRFEEKVYRNRVITIKTLLNNTIIDKNVAESLEEIPYEEFRNSQGCDQIIMLLPTQKLLQIREPLKAFKLVQFIYYLGYGMVVSDRLRQVARVALFD